VTVPFDHNALTKYSLRFGSHHYNRQASCLWQRASWGRRFEFRSSSIIFNVDKTGCFENSFRKSHNLLLLPHVADDSLILMFLVREVPGSNIGP